MEGCAEASKRPLLEEEDPSHPVLSRAAPRPDPDTTPGDSSESYSLLQDDVTREISPHGPSPGRNPGRSPQGAEPLQASLPTGGVLHLLQTEDVPRSEPRPMERMPEIHQRSASSAEDSVVIEMHSMGQDGSRELLPVVSGAANATRQGDDRNCFICLQDSDKDNPLVSCCSTCYACTHRRCWREWRNNQHRTALRSHLLGLRMQTNHMLRCTICKSGTAMVEGEENGLSWMNELMCGGEPSENSLLGRLVALGNRREDSDEDPEAQLEDLIDTRTCVALVIYLGMLIVAIIIACLLIVTQGFWAGDVVLCCIIALYELSVLQLVMLAILRRRDIATTATQQTRQTEEAPSTQNAREIQLRTLG